MQTVNSQSADGANLMSTHEFSMKLHSNNSNSYQLYNRDSEPASNPNDKDTKKSVSTVTPPLNQRSSNLGQIKLFVQHPNESQYSWVEKDDIKLMRLINEYKTDFNSSSCDEEACRNLRKSSQKVLQSLIEKINNQTRDLKPSEIPKNNLSRSIEFKTMERNSLSDLVMEKDKRIQYLEKLLEVQKRLRVQDANQVEEKAARIKEWVANKLRELENQNRQLRDQNKKHKETVDSLSNRLASLSQQCTPKRTVKTDMNKVIDRLTSSSQSDIGSYSHCPVAQSRKKSLDLVGYQRTNTENHTSFSKVIAAGELTSPHPSKIECSDSNSNQTTRSRMESPIYDSVSFDKTNQEVGKISRNHDEGITTEDIPPPPPLHQRDKWELELYGMADEIFSSINKKIDDDSYLENDPLTSPDSYSDHRVSRKSTSSVRNDLISLAKPNFTTIDGNNVVDDNSIQAALYSNDVDKMSDEWTPSELKPKFMSIQKERELERTKQETENQSVFLTFDSPIRSKKSKDSLLKTQSVRRSIESERLFNFISTDLVKRGWLVKPGTLKNHLRWIVLKNFHLHIYKNESDELSKVKAITTIKLNSDCSIQLVNQSGESCFPFKILYNDKYLQLIADSSLLREEWIRILTVTINMSNIDSQMLTKQNASWEGLLSITRHGHTKRCYGILINHVVFFLRSITDPTPLSYLSVKMAKIKEITNNFDHNLEDVVGDKSSIQDCSLAVYPKYSLTLDPLYMTMGSQQDTDRWLHHLSITSGVEQSFGTPFEQTLTRFMINRSMSRDSKNNNTFVEVDDSSSIQYTDQPITEPLTSLPNETLKVEALELFKSILLITRVPVEPVAIDYHVSLIQKCLSRFLEFPELRNEFFAQVIKQSNYVQKQVTRHKLSSSSSGCSVEMNQYRTSNPITPQSPTNHDISESSSVDLKNLAQQPRNSITERDYNHNDIAALIPSDSELLQVMQIIAIAVSLNLPKGRIRWWLINTLEKIAHPSTDIGKYALYTLRAIERTRLNGSRENVPSRTEIISIMLRNPQDHSHPHSLPVCFSDGSYVVAEADGSTTVEEFITTLVKNIDVRESSCSDFYLFADDPSGSKDLHILEPYRKVLDIVGWWEQTFRLNNHGKYENTKVIKLIFKKRLVLKAEDKETHQERSLIVHQFHQEVNSQKIHLNDNLIMKLAALIAQITYGNIIRLEEAGTVEQILEKVVVNLLPKFPSQPNSNRNQDNNTLITHRNEMANRWRQLSDKSPEDCVRIYLNCIRRLNLCIDNRKEVSI